MDGYSFFFFFVVVVVAEALGVEPRALSMLSKHSVNEPNLVPVLLFTLRQSCQVV